MDHENTIVLLGDGAKAEAGMDVFDVKIPVNGEMLSFRFGAIDCQATLLDLVGPAWEVCDAIVSDTLRRLEKKGTKVTCKAKCATCCSYIVPSIAPEAFAIDDRITSLEQQQRKTVLRNTLAAIEKIQTNSFTAVGDDKATGDMLGDLSQWYKKLEIACPFLVDSQCAIYDSRPLVCRELLTISDASACSKETPETPESVNLPVSIAEAMIKTCDKLDETSGGIILLPLIIPWCQSNANLAEKTWPAKKLVKTFIESIDESITKIINAEEL